MELEKTKIEGLFLMHRPIRGDTRGYFTRLFGEDEISKAGRPTKAVHVNTSMSKDVGTLRGIHLQYEPYCETKVVSCLVGSIWDVAIDLRPESPTRFEWFGVNLTPDNGKSLIIPEGFGHAFITLEPNTSVVYVVSNTYALHRESGFRFDDPDLNIKWPIKPTVISDKDIAWGKVADRLEELNEGLKTTKFK